MDDKTVLVTGCSSGIGLVTSKHLMENDWNVLATARKDKDVKMLDNLGVTGIQLDLRSEKSIDQAVAHMLESCRGSLRAIVNNAGYLQPGSLEDMDIEAIRAQFDTTVAGPIHLTSRLIPIFRENGQGRIIFIGGPNYAFPFLTLDGASKSALNMVIDGYRRELSDDPISVSVIYPGLIRTRILEKSEDYFNDSIDLDNTIYTEEYEGLNKYLYGLRDKGHEASIVAERVLEVLETAKPPIRSFVPWTAIFHDIAHKLLPIQVQDWICHYRLKNHYKIKR